jgi:hypothetical protein
MFFFFPYAMPCHAIVRARRPAHLCLCLCCAWDTGCYVLYVASSIVTVGARHAGHASMYHCIYIHLSLVDLSMLDLLMLDLSMPNLSMHRATRSTRCRAHRAPTTVSADDDTKPIIAIYFHLKCISSMSVRVSTHNVWCHATAPSPQNSSNFILGERIREHNRVAQVVPRVQPTPDAFAVPALLTTPNH